MPDFLANARKALQALSVLAFDEKRSQQCQAEGFKGNIQLFPAHSLPLAGIVQLAPESLEVLDLLQYT